MSMAYTKYGWFLHVFSLGLGKRKKKYDNLQQENKFGKINWCWRKDLMIDDVEAENKRILIMNGECWIIRK